MIFFIGSVEEGYALIEDMEPNTPQEYILKAVANTLVGQERGSVRLNSLIFFFLPAGIIIFFSEREP